MKRDEVVGQQEVLDRLWAMRQEQRLPHALMLCGPEGCGKMAVALALASELLGHSPMLRNWAHPDLHFTYPTVKLPGMGSEHQPVSDDFAAQWRGLLAKGPYFSMDQWMVAMGATNQQAVITGAESDALAHKLSLKSSQGGYKVSIVWLPERMNLTCANKLLKLLEEPPVQTVFIMVCEHPERLLETIRSRTQRMDLKRIRPEDIERALVERRGLEPQVAERMARMAGGSWLKALETLDANGESREFLELFAQFMRSAYRRDVKELKTWCEAVGAYGREKQKRLLAYFGHMVRESFMANFHEPQLSYMTIEESRFTERFAPFINEANVIEMAEVFSRAERDIGQNANGKIVFFDLALKTILLLVRKP
ncbi:MAG: ATP-binding protein [Prevotella sp.]